MTFNDPGLGSGKGISKGISKGQWLAIVVIILVGALLAALILLSDKGSDNNPFDDDGPGGAQKSAEPAQREQPKVVMDDEQIKAAAIEMGAAGPARIATVLQFPGEIQLNDDRTVHVVPRVPGVAESVLVSTGQIVKKGQLLAVLSSQMISEQRSALRAAERRLGHAQSIFTREKRLWEQKISAEQDYLQAQHSVQEAELELENARQKLAAVGANTGERGLNRFELRAPYDGLVVERNLSIGESVKEDAPIFTISDLSTVWAEVHIPAKDLPYVRVGGQLTVRATAFEAKATGSVAFVGALVGEQTRMAKARILLANPKGAWRPGLFVTVEVNASDVQVPVAVDSEAIQTLGTQPVVFIRNENSFVPRAVKLGITDGRSIEVTEGLPPGTRYAGKGSYILKSELSKLASEDGY